MLKQKGFTLIEVVMVIIILGLVATIGAPIIFEATVSQTAASNIANAASQAEFALQRMSRKIRQIRSNSFSGIGASSATSITFTTASGQTIRYFLDGTDLKVTESGSTGILIDNVSGLTFSYYDADGAVTSTVTEMRFIRIDLTVSIGSTGSLPLQAIVYLRNSIAP